MAKAAIFTLDGREVASDRRPNQVFFPRPGHTEVDADAMWDAVCAAVRGAMAQGGIRPSQIVGLSTTGHGNAVLADAALLRHLSRRLVVAWHPGASR